MSSSKNEVMEALKGTTHYGSPHGICCYFVPLDEFWGIKVYFEEEKRDYCHEWQEKAAAHGLGPQTGEWFDLPDNRYCYITEIVETLVEFEGGCKLCTTEERHELDRQWAAKRRELVEKLADIGFHFYDYHWANIGLNHEGDLVCIDFGDD